MDGPLSAGSVFAAAHAPVNTHEAFVAESVSTAARTLQLKNTTTLLLIEVDRLGSGVRVVPVFKCSLYQSAANGLDGEEGIVRRDPTRRRHGRLWWAGGRKNMGTQAPKRLSRPNIFDI